MRCGGRKVPHFSGNHLWAGYGRVSRHSPGLKERKEEGLAEASRKGGREEKVTEGRVSEGIHKET